VGFCTRVSDIVPYRDSLGAVSVREERAPAFFL
jgi:hypothetical protein